MPSKALQAEIIRQSQLAIYGQQPPPGRINPFNVSGIHPLLAFLMPALAKQLFGTDFIATQFFPQQSLYSRMQALQYERMRSSALAVGAQADRTTQQELMRGIAESLGIEITPELKRAFSELSGVISKFMPLLAEMFPDLINTLHGRTGSAAVMASRVASASRFMVDPLTGRFGLSSGTTSELIREIARLIPGGGLRALGMDAGRAGLLFSELQRRGLGLSGGIGTITDREEQLREVSRVTGTDIESLRRLADEDLATYDSMLRRVDAERIKKRIKEMAGVVDALRDIFGDMGNPNAPMAQLIGALEMLTQNNLASFSPAQMEQLVRTTQMVLRHTGMSLDTMLAMQTAGGSQADKLGLDRSLVPGISNSAALFGSAVIAAGRLDIPAFGSRSLEQLAIRDQQLRMRAAASPIVQQMAVLVRAQEAGLLREGSEAFEYAQQLMRDPTAARAMTTTEWLQLMEAGGVDRATAMSMLHATYTNQEAIRDYRLFEGGRALQLTADILPAMANTAQQAIAGEVARAGLEGEISQEEIAAAASRVSEAVLRAAPEVQRDRDRLREYISQTLQEDPALEGRITPEAAARLTEVMLGDFENTARFTGYQSLQELFTLHNPVVLDERRRQARQVEREVRLSRAMSRLGRSGPLRRVISLFTEGEAPDTFREAMGLLFGGVKAEEVFEAAAQAGEEDLGRMDRVERAAAMTQAVAELSSVLSDDEATTAEYLQAGQSITAIIEGGQAAQSRLTARLRGLKLTDMEIAQVLQGDETVLRSALRRQKGVSEEDVERQVREITALRIAAAGGGLSIVAPDEAIVGNEEIERNLTQIQKRLEERRAEAAFESRKEEIRKEISTTEDASRREYLTQVLEKAEAGGEQAYKQLRRILAAEGMAPEEIDAVIRGEKEAPEQIRREVATLLYRSQKHIEKLRETQPELRPAMAEEEMAAAPFDPSAIFSELKTLFEQLVKALTQDKKVAITGKLQIEGDEGQIEAEGTEYGSVDR